MNTFIFENTTIQNVELSAKTPTKLSSITSSIFDVSSTNTPVVLSGNFFTNFKFTNSCNINIENDFTLNSGSFSLINNELPTSTFLITGILSNNMSYFNLATTTNTRIIMGFWGNPNGFINLNCDSKSEFGNSLIISPYNIPPNTYPLPLNLNNSTSSNISIFSDINTINFLNDSNINLFISPNANVVTFKNVTTETFSYLSTTPELLEKIKSQNNLTNLTLSATTFKIPVKNGIAKLTIPKSSNISNAPNTSIVFSQNRYQINNI